VDEKKIEARLIADIILDEGRRFEQLPFAPSDFSGEYRKLYAEIVNQMAEYGSFTAVTLFRGGQTGTLLSEMLQDGCPTTLDLHASHLKRIITEKAIARAKEELISHIKNSNDHDAAIAEFEKNKRDAETRFTDSNNDLMTALQEFEYILKNKKTGETIVTGVQEVDELTCGGLSAEYIILAARPSIGKTAFALQILMSLAQQDIKSCFFSAEMSGTMLVSRLLARIANSDVRHAIRRPESLQEADREALLRCFPNAKYFAERIKTITECNLDKMFVQAKYAVENGAKIVVVDYLQILKGEGRNREQEVSNISRLFKNMSKRLNIPVIALSQLSRDCEKEHRFPRNADLRDSGSIEQDADVIWFLSGDIPDSRNKKVDENKVLLLQTKGRNIGIGIRELNFDKKTQTFSAYS
jgi:replicative DNA helicase